jgi:predicted Kef-type K+ transport protein
LLALALVVFGALVALLGARSPRLRETDWREWRQAAAIFVVCAFAALALERLGYRVTVSAMLLVLLGVVERRGLLVTLACALGLAFGSYYLFDTLLRVPLPRGPYGF